MTGPSRTASSPTATARPTLAGRATTASSRGERDRRRWSPSPAGSCCTAARASWPSPRCATAPARVQLFALADGHRRLRRLRQAQPRRLDRRHRRGREDQHGRAVGEGRVVDVLAETRRGFPDKWHGVTDPDTRYRQRYVDLWANPESRADASSPAAASSALTRRWLEDRGFVEVETPIFHPIPGGAPAKPFTTHHNALDTRPVPAHRARALPQAARGRRLRAGVRDRPGVPQRGPVAPGTTPSSRCSSSTRPTPTTAT